jgi:hypothetical protein
MNLLLPLTEIPLPGEYNGVGRAVFAPYRRNL